MLSCVPAGIVWGISGWARVRKTVTWWMSILGLGLVCCARGEVWLHSGCAFVIPAS